MRADEQNSSEFFFVDRPGGTGKTYLYRALLASIRIQDLIALTTATLGIIATLMPEGSTTHSRFKIPLNPDHSSMCSINKQSDLVELIRRTMIILWDEATMTNRYAIVAVDRTFQDVIGINTPFSGKIMVFGGDFRQMLPVIPNGIKAETITTSIVKSPLWMNVQVLRLKQNMHSINDEGFVGFLLRVGDGSKPTTTDDMITIPTSIKIPWDVDESIDQLLEEIYPDIGNHAHDGAYMVGRGLITTHNENVDRFNERVLQRFPGQPRTYYFFDKVDNDSHNLYQQEFLNSISPGDLPPHMFNLKHGALIMLIRNIDPTIGLCNGTRLLCHALNNNFIDVKILTGPFKVTRVFLPRIPLKTPKNIKFPFKVTHTQFPVRLSFALTINKSQGQTIPHVGVYLPDNVFSHGQLFIVLSRGVSAQTTMVLVKKDSNDVKETVYTCNVVYREILWPNNPALI